MPRTQPNDVVSSLVTQPARHVDMIVFRVNTFISIIIIIFDIFIGGGVRLSHTMNNLIIINSFL